MTLINIAHPNDKSFEYLISNRRHTSGINPWPIIERHAPVILVRTHRDIGFVGRSVCSSRTQIKGPVAVRDRIGIVRHSAAGHKSRWRDSESLGWDNGVDVRQCGCDERVGELGCGDGLELVDGGPRGGHGRRQRE